MELQSFVVSAENARMRLDAFLVKLLPHLSRAQIQDAILSHGVTLNHKICTKAAQRIAQGDSIAWHHAVQPEHLDLSPKLMPLDIVFEDHDILVLNKDAGVVVHAGAGHFNDTLVNGLIAHYAPIIDVGQKDRPGIVHRLDKDTSGLMVVAKTQCAYDKLVSDFASHQIMRCYHALCYAPKLPENGKIETFFGRNPNDRIKFTSKLEQGKQAITHYQVLHRFAHGFAQIECKLQTGRTHQVRVHLSENGAPILGDILYAPKNIAKTPWISRVALHATALRLLHPTSLQSLYFQAPYPRDFEHCLHILNHR